MHPLEAIDNIARLIERAYQVQRPIALVGAVVLLEIPDATITSGRRSVERNRRVGGAKNSYHLRGRALDIDVPDAYRNNAYDIGVESDCIELLPESDHIHFAK